MNEMRKDRRAPASLKVKYKSATVDDFIEQFGADVSRGGIFIKTKKPLDTGALLKFEFQLQGGAPVIHGVGRVAWRRLEDKARADLPAGMGIKFIKLDDQSRAVIDRIEVRHGPGSRFEQIEAAELAPPLSSLPPSPALNGSTAAAPPAQPRATASPSARRFSGGPSHYDPAAHDQPTFRPPPPAVGSVPPALAEAFAAATPTKPPARSTAPKGALGSFMGDAGPRKNTSIRSTARDTSEFLASAFSVGGAGQEVRSQARVQVERARRDPQSVDLANELFGDLSEPRMGEPITSEPPGMSDLKPASEPKPLTAAERSLADRIPSMEELVNEVTGSGPDQARGGNGSLRGGAGALDSVPALRGGGSLDPGPALRGGADPGSATRGGTDPAPAPRSGTGRTQPSSPGAMPAPPAAARGSGAAGPRTGSSELRPRSHTPDPRAAAAPEAGLPQGSAKPRAGSTPAAGSQKPELEAARADSVAPLSLALSAPPQAANAESARAEGGGRNVTGFVFGGVALVALALAAYFFMQKPPLPADASPQPSAAPSPAPAAPPASAASQPAVQTTVDVDVTSEPGAAQVLLDGKPAGSTPAKLSLTSTVAVELTVRRPGYASKTEKVSPEAGMRPKHFVLEPLPYELAIATTPPGATVRVNELSATSPEALKLGHVDGLVNATIEKEGFQRQTRAIPLDEFSEENGVMRASVTLSLAPLPSAKKRPAAPLAPPPPVPSTDAPPEPGATDTPPPPPVMQVKPVESSPDEPAETKPKAEAAPAPPAAAPSPAAPAEPPAP